MTGISALIAMKIVGSFALGWYLGGRSKSQNAARDKEQLQLALEALDRITRGSEKIVEDHGSRLEEVSQELREFSENEISPQCEAVAGAAERIQTIGQEMRDSLADLAREVMAELGIDDDDKPASNAKAEKRGNRPSDRSTSEQPHVAEPAAPAPTLVTPVAQSQWARALEGQADLEPGGVLIDDRENRSSERFAFEHTVHIAPCRNARSVRRADFHPMLGRDISVSGFSFFSETRPRFDKLVVAINGLDGDRIFMAEIVHSTLVDKHYVVGCRFLERVMEIPH